MVMYLLTWFAGDEPNQDRDEELDLVMAIFHLNFREGNELSADTEGSTFHSLEEAYMEAFESAQEMWIELMKKRRNPMACAFEIMDQAGRLLLTLPFSEVLKNCKGITLPKPTNNVIGTAIQNAGRSVRLTAELTTELGIMKRRLQATRSLLADPGGP